MIDRLSLTSILLEPCFNEQKLGAATGFIIEKDGKYYLATNWHVVTGINPLTGQAMHSQGGLPAFCKPQPAPSKSQKTTAPSQLLKSMLA